MSLCSFTNLYISTHTRTVLQEVYTKRNGVADIIDQGIPGKVNLSLFHHLGTTMLRGTNHAFGYLSLLASFKSLYVRAACKWVTCQTASLIDWRSKCLGARDQEHLRLEAVLGSLTIPDLLHWNSSLENFFC